MSPHKIIGPAYRVINQRPHKPMLKFIPPKGGTELTFDLSLTLLNAQEPQRFILSCDKENDPDKETVASLDLMIKNRRGYLQDYHRVPTLGGTNIKYILRNLAIQFLVKNYGIKPIHIVCDRPVWNHRNLLGVLRFNYDYGFSRMSNKGVQKFMTNMVRHRNLLHSGTVKDLETPGNPLVWALINVDWIVMFKPEYSQQEIEELARSLGYLQTECKEGRAFPSHNSYFLTAEAAAIMPDYLKLLPESPEW